ncbi:hypothetical protein DO97_20720 [Neosynechococcus sphagnicola sy1]|uniref:Crystallin n=1 Tax=Neosynechococcus sphagnicola sy1 TaxID=1497020 RepID=A0A098TH85_9CYAN|nr:ADP-ribosylglycohydrolase family protein [Neosynechococcus sphagnicola]KGF71396.1 hypothetical protein DO97_20720 [Neosynechococcus sphagnicola sy1]
MPSKDQYLGCILGLALGDAMGAPYEGGILEQLIWKLIGRTKDGLPRWTDDTQMSIDIAMSLLDNGELNQLDLSTRFANSYKWSRGYGPGTARLLKRIGKGEPWQKASMAIFKNGSFGNGAAMRASILALYFNDNIDRLLSETKRSAEITHSHPLAIEGAILIALTTHLIINHVTIDDIINTLKEHCKSKEFGTQLKIIHAWLSSNHTPSPKEIAKTLGNGMTAQSSVMSSICIAFLHFDKSFSELLSFARSCKGDVDTISAMAGTLWGARNGATTIYSIPIEQRQELEQIAVNLFNQVNYPSPA